MNRDVCEHFNPVDLPCEKCSVQKSTLREAAQQALEALKNIDKEFSKHGRQHWPEAVKARAAIAPLRAALAEPEPPPEAQTEAEKIAYCAGWWDAMAKAREAEPVQEPVATLYGTLPIYDTAPQTAEPEQKPVALETVYETILHWDEGGGKRSRRELARRIVDLYTAPPQRKPLTEEEIGKVAAPYYGTMGFRVEAFARAIERTHGIGDSK